MKKIARIAALCLTGFLLFLILLGAITTDKTDIPSPYKGKHITILNNKIRYIQTGKGADLLFIHGTPGVAEDWVPIVKLLKKKFRITTYDRPGYGFSGTKETEYSIQQNAQIALQLIQKLNLKNTTVIGHSFGGAIAMAMATKNISNIKQYLLLSAKLFPPFKKEAILYLITAPLVGRGLTTLSYAFQGINMFRPFMGKAFSPAQIPANFLRNRKELWGQTKVMVSTAKEILNNDKQLGQAAARYSKIDTKFYFIHGTQDQISRFSEAEKAKKMTKQSKLFPIKEGGHYPQFTHPKKIAQLIQQIAGSKNR